MCDDGDGLSIDRSDEDCIGLFGWVGGEIRHVGVVTDRIIGRNRVGSLVGVGEDAKIIQSYAVNGEVRGDHRVGGLVGNSDHFEIVQSYAVSSRVSGEIDHAGGLVGYDRYTKIIQSFVVSGEVSGDGSVGGLGFVGEGSSIRDSYWDNETNGDSDDASGSQARNSITLHSPTGYTGIYDTWDDGVIPEGDRVADIDYNGTIWCDEDLSGSIETDERRDNNRIWDFGSGSDYPALRCTSDSLASQRAWWHLNAAHKPQLNQTHLDAWLDGSLP